MNPDGQQKDCRNSLKRRKKRAPIAFILCEWRHSRLLSQPLKISLQCWTACLQQLCCLFVWMPLFSPAHTMVCGGSVDAFASFEAGWSTLSNGGRNPRIFPVCVKAPSSLAAVLYNLPRRILLGDICDWVPRLWRFLCSAERPACNNGVFWECGCFCMIAACKNIALTILPHQPIQRMHTAWQNTSRESTGSATREFTLCFANVQMLAILLAKMAGYISVISQNSWSHTCY